MTDDTHSWECPKCENSNPLKLFKCKHCKVGMRPSAQQIKDGIERDRQGCFYVSYKTGKQCPLAGVVSDRIGQGVPWWCGDHMKHQKGPEAEAVYENNVRNYDEIVAAAKPKDLLAWWESDGKAQREKEKQEAAARPATTADEAARRLDAEAIVERLAIQQESGVQADADQP